VHFVEVAAFRPQRCAVVPFIGAHHPNGFIDTGNELDGNRIYISLVGLAEMARVARIIPPAVPDLSEDLARAHALVEQLEAELEDSRAQLAAIGTLKLAGATTARPVGRPKKVA
jgi:hypothetical protein